MFYWKGVYIIQTVVGHSIDVLEPFHDNLRSWNRKIGHTSKAIHELIRGFGMDIRF